MTDEELLELWNERAAIREHDGGQSKRQAEYRAAKDLQRMFGQMPDVIRRTVQQSR